MMSPEDKEALNEMMPVVNEFLRRVYSDQHPFTMNNAVAMRVLDPVALEPQLHRLLLSTEFGVKGVLEKMKVLRALYLGIRKQEDFFTIEFYRDSGTILAPIFYHKDDRVTLFHIFTDFRTVDIQNISIERAPCDGFSGLLVVIIHLVETLRRRGEIGCSCPPANLCQFSSVNSRNVGFPESKKESGKSEEPTAPGDKDFTHGKDVMGAKA